MAIGSKIGYYNWVILDRKKKKQTSWYIFTFWWRKANKSILQLAKPLAFDDFLTSYQSFIPESTIVKYLVLYELVFDRRKDYATAINSYIFFPILYNNKPWPALITILEKWAVTRIYGNTLSKQTQIKPDIVLNYISTLIFILCIRSIITKRFYIDINQDVKKKKKKKVLLYWSVT